MTERAPRIVGSFEDKKFREELAILLSTARRTLFVTGDLRPVNLGVDEVVYTKEIALEKLRIQGSSIEIYIYATIIPAAAGNNSVGIHLTDQDDNSIAFVGTPFFTATTEVRFKVVIFNKFGTGKKIYMASDMITNSADEGEAQYDIGSVSSDEISRLKIKIEAVADGPNSNLILFARGEFIPSLVN